MPYILQEQRDSHDEWIDALCQGLEEEGYDVGLMTYVIYKIVVSWFKYEPRYKTIAKIRGMLAGVLSEFDRRFAFDYENQKIIENGDVDTSTTTLEAMKMTGMRVGVDPECEGDCCAPWLDDEEDLENECVDEVAVTVDDCCDEFGRFVVDNRGGA